LRPRPHRLFSCVRLQYELADAGQTYGVNVAVTSVDARNVKFDIKSTTNQSPDMTLSPPPRAEVYLVENRLNPISTRAALELTDDNLRCTVKEYSKWVEKALGISDLRSRLQAGEAVAAFDFRRDQLKIKWLKQFLKAGFAVSEGSSRRWLVSLVYPTGIMALVEVVDGWDVHNEWRRALPPT
jgi:hypothetical protein